MARVGTCQDCNARYKIPDSFSGTRAKCKKCGGVVAIGSSGAAAGASAAKPAAKAPVAKAPAAKAPQKAPQKAPVAPKKAAARVAAKGAAAPKVAAGAAPTATSKRSKRAKSAGGAGARGGKGRGRSRKGGDDKKKGLSPGALLGIILAVVVLAVGGWYFAMGPGSGSDTPAPADTTATDGAEQSTDGGDAETATLAEAGDDSATAAPTDAETDGADDAAADTPGDDAAAPSETAAEPAPEVERTRADLDLDPVLAFEPLPPTPGTTQEQLDEWTALVNEYFFEAPGLRRRKQIKSELDELDIVDASPAFINPLQGKDLTDESTIRDTWTLVDYYQERVAGNPHFAFEGDLSKRDKLATNNRILALVGAEGTRYGEGLVGYVRGKISDPEKLAQWRINIAEDLRDKADDEG